MSQSPPAASFGSEPEFSRTDDTEFVKSRKRKNYPDKEEITQLRTDIQKMFENLKEDQESKFRKLNNMIGDLKDQNKEIIISNDTLRKTLEETTGLYRDLKQKYDTLLLESTVANKKIRYLEDEVDALQRKQLENIVEIKNVPVTDNENLTEIVNQLHNSLKISITPPQVRQVYRKKSGPNKPIFVEYQTAQTRANVLKAIKSYNMTNKEEKYNTKALKISGNPQPVYISEALTPNGRRLFYQCRELKKKYDFKFCWVSNGRVLLKKSEDQPAILVKSSEQIQGIINSISTPSLEL